MAAVPLRVTAVVVNYNARPFLERCLRALLAQRDVDLQVIVVDNASEDGSVEMVREQFPRVHLVASPQNLGLAGGTNRGFEDATGDYLATMNMDVEPEPDALARMAAHLRDHPEVGAVGPHLLNPDGTLQPSGRPLPTPGRALSDRYGLWRLSGRDRFLQRGRDYDSDLEVGEVSGSFIMVPRRILDQVGPYDQAAFFAYYEDADWCRRIATHGYRVFYLGRARVTHEWAGSFGANLESANLMARRGMLRYFRKHHGAGAARLVRALLLPADLAALVRWTLVALIRPRAIARRRRAAAVLRLTWAASTLSWDPGGLAGPA
ncbi:MAG: glycosyltransferase family 2 protein [Candidatus Dormibacteria bacterium]